MTIRTLLVRVPRAMDTPCSSPTVDHDWRPTAVHVNYAQRTCANCNASEHSSREAPGAPWHPWVPASHP